MGSTAVARNFLVRYGAYGAPPPLPGAEDLQLVTVDYSFVSFEDLARKILTNDGLTALSPTGGTLSYLYHRSTRSLVSIDMVVWHVRHAMNMLDLL